MENNSFKIKLFKLLGLSVGGTAFLWALWAFGMSDTLTQGMSPFATHALEVFVAVGITSLALLGPASLFVKLIAEERAGLEAQAEKTTARYRAIVEKSHDIILEVDETGKIYYANPAVLLLGYERQELVGQPIKCLIPEADQKEVLPHISTRRVGPRATINFPLTLLTNDDSVLSYEVPLMKFMVDASGLWNVPDEVVRIKGSEKTFLGTLVIASPVREG